MLTKVPLDKSNRIEVEFLAPSLKFRTLADLDTLLSSMHSPALVIEPSFLQDLNVVRFQRNSQYKVIGSIDRKFATFGGNKIYEIQNMIEADGFDVGLTNGRSEVELRNEILGIDRFLKTSGRQFFIRWVIDVAQGSEHIENCVKAIRNSKVLYEAIVIKANGMEAKVMHEIVAKCRKLLGQPKAAFKIISSLSDDLIVDDTSLSYQIPADQLK